MEKTLMSQNAYHKVHIPAATAIIFAIAGNDKLFRKIKIWPKTTIIDQQCRFHCPYGSKGPATSATTLIFYTSYYFVVSPVK